MSINRSRKTGPVNIAILSEELARSCHSVAELNAVCDVCARLHRLDPEQEQDLLAASEAAFKQLD
ncbi:hypothetical protein [Magnetospirillum sp. 64-120]|uniref:hypothetical protein n=1 Tax=Magnetospirillum sp. 64-120 TaxID=1895778 RepID=UPI0025C61E80|nr:hypothetical protein [Magnetospirillum sp. 64-120]